MLRVSFHIYIVGFRIYWNIARQQLNYCTPYVRVSFQIMEFLDGRQPSELLDAQTHIWNHMLNMMHPFTLKCAIQLGIPDVIHNHGTPMTVSELVEALGINKSKTQSLYRLMRILTHSGFFQKQQKAGSGTEDEESYLLAPPSRLLLKGEPLTVRLFGTEMANNHLYRLSDWYKADEATSFHMENGKSFWEFLADEKTLSDVFNDYMASDSRLVSCALIKDCEQVFQNLTSIVDVGGGNGVMMKAISAAFPQLHCISFDQPHVIACQEGTKNLTFVAGDLFQAIPSANAVMIKWILHSWNDEDAVRLLKECKKAIPSKEKGGKVIIIDMVVGDREGDFQSTETQLMFDLLMMSYFAGGERDEKQWAKLFAEAGFSHYEITHKLGLRSIIQLFP